MQALSLVIMVKTKGKKKERTIMEMIVIKTMMMNKLQKIKLD
jgi:hypothetical protein